MYGARNIHKPPIAVAMKICFFAEKISLSDVVVLDSLRDASGWAR